MIPNANLWLRAADMRFGWADRDDGRGDQVPNSAQVPEDQGRLLQILEIQRSFSSSFLLISMVTM